MSGINLNNQSSDSPIMNNSLMLSSTGKTSSKSDKKQLKAALAEKIERSKQIKQKLNKFLSRETSDTQNTLDQHNNIKSKQCSIQNSETHRSSLDDIEQYFQALERRSNKTGDPNKEIQSATLIRSAGSLSKENIEGYEVQDYQSRKKRNNIYEHESKKQKFQDLDQSMIQTNNRIFQEIFLKKTPIVQDPQPVQEIKTSFIPKLSNWSIDDFILMKKLGSGKSGEVFLSKHKETNFICAIKRIKKRNIDSQTLTQIIREIKIQIYLNHSNIAQLYSFLSDSQCIYLIMEYCTGGDLYSLLKQNKKMTEQVVKDLITQVCAAINFMHENNIIHRDLKPENILYQHGMIKICDFGWSISSTITRQTFCGTPLYVSPELLQKNSYGNKIDVWSVGILTYELLFGRVPFDIFTESDLIKIVKK